MARPLRIEFPGAVYHVISRGNGRQTIFRDNWDRERFLSVFALVVERYNFICHAYCLMSNHFHLLLETPDGNISQGMRQLNSQYSQGFNRRHETVGHVVQGRYRSVLVEKESYLLELCRYVVLNPVRAGLVENPFQWKWSSYRATTAISTAEVPDFLSVDWILSLFSAKDRRKAISAYRRFVRAGLNVPGTLAERFKKDLILGDERFVGRFRELLRGKSVLKEIPRVQRFAARPPLEEIFRGATDKRSRNRSICEAHVHHGYKMNEIAQLLGIHYSTVSRVLGKAEM